MAGKVKIQRRKAARPDEIIAAALDEFSQMGFAAAKLENVAKRAGVVKGTIYRYFPSKTALFKAALQPKTAPIFENASDMIEDFQGSSEQLLRLVITGIYHQVFRTDLYILLRIIITEGARFPEIAKVYHDQTITKGMAVLQKIIDRGVGHGEFSAGPASSSPIAIIGPLIAASVWQMTFDDIAPLDIEKLAEAHLDLVLNGLKSSNAG